MSKMTVLVLKGARASHAAPAPAHRRARRGPGALPRATDARRARHPEAPACLQRHVQSSAHSFTGSCPRCPRQMRPNPVAQALPPPLASTPQCSGAVRVRCPARSSWPTRSGRRARNRIAVLRYIPSRTPEHTSAQLYSSYV